MKHKIDVEGFVLAGGANSRMGRAKWQLEIGGETFLARAVAALSAVASSKLSIVGDNLPAAIEIAAIDSNLSKFSVLSDNLNADSAKPRASLIGLHSALANAQSDWAIILACDLPFVSAALINRLAELAEKSSGFDAVVPLQPDGFPQPLCAFYRPQNGLNEARQMLENKDYRLRDLLRRVKTRFVNFAEISDLPDAAAFFFNVNTPEDYAAAQDIHDKN